MLQHHVEIEHTTYVQACKIALLQQFSRNYGRAKRTVYRSYQDAREASPCLSRCLYLPVSLVSVSWCVVWSRGGYFVPWCAMPTNLLETKQKRGAIFSKIHSARHARMHTPDSAHSRYQYSVLCALNPGSQNQLKTQDSQQPICRLLG